ncbi:MAG: 1-acyl-sn-glycerol-3-phosphate acyltransferase [Clostridia bacterium]|nr:1-acyl-sn-glycerol-3-phosphate acyltransferase [Clostridia bacterium]
MIYHFLRLLSFVLVRPFYRIKYNGKANVPKGAFVLASNHISYFDPICLGMGFRRKIWFMAKSELFTNHGAFAGTFLRLCGVFPVVRSSADKGAVDKASELLHKGKIVGVFPQGGIRRDGQPFEPKAGAALLAAKNCVPLLPVLIKAEGKIRPFSKISVTIGEAVFPTDDSLKGARELNRRFKAQINKMSEE